MRTTRPGAEHDPDAADDRPRRRALLGTAAFTAPLAAVGAVLAWLNRSPWWGWALLALALAGIGAVRHRMLAGRPPRRRLARVLVGVATWVAAAAVVAPVGVLPATPPTTRPAGDPNAATAAVATTEGPITGVRLDDDVDLFAGVPYAAPPVGDLRWRAPQPPQPRSETLAADRFSAVPMQATSSFSSRALAQVVDIPLEQTFANPYPVGEDSLTLNVWRPSTPSASAARPVLVFVPGGGFATGSGALPLYDGAALAARGDIVTVTLNYRLGVFGFLSHPHLAAEADSGASGNYGVLDQIAALHWIRNNAAAFGGDPDRVTVAGESAGGESACILGATPLARGLVDGLIGSSGACMGTTGDVDRGDQGDDRAAAEAAGLRFAASLGDASIDELRAMPAERILEAAAPLAAHWRPSVDGHVLDRAPAEIYASGEQLDVPLLTGSNAHESSLALASPPDGDPVAYRRELAAMHGADAARALALYPGATPEQVVQSRLAAQTDRTMTRAHRRWALLHSSSGAPVYTYFFTRTPPDPRLERFGAFHGADVMYAYDNLTADSDADFTAVDLRLRDEMAGAWIAFVRTGDPNHEAMPRWPTVAEAPGVVMEFGADGAAVVPRPRAPQVDFWLDYAGPLP